MRFVCDGEAMSVLNKFAIHIPFPFFGRLGPVSGNLFPEIIFPPMTFGYLRKYFLGFFCMLKSKSVFISDIVIPHVFRSASYDKILDPVVAPISVYMMNNLFWKKGPSNAFFHNESMLKGCFPANTYDDISVVSFPGDSVFSSPETCVPVPIPSHVVHSTKTAANPILVATMFCAFVSHVLIILNGFYKCQ